MGEGGADGSNVEVINIPLAQEDELADIPAAMREVVAAEIAAFRERSNQRDMERLRREEEFEEMERLRNGAPHPSRNDSPPPRSAPAASSVPKGPSGGQGRSMAFINGGTDSDYKEGGDTDTSDNELHRRQLAKQAAEDDKQYLEAERKWSTESASEPLPWSEKRIATRPRPRACRGGWRSSRSVRRRGTTSGNSAARATCTTETTPRGFGARPGPGGRGGAG